MSWVRVDDKFFTHPKVIRAGAEAIGVWLVACCWASTQGTNGRLPLDVLETLPGYKKAVANRLVLVGLWDEIRDESDQNLIGFQIHDYLEFNPSAEELKAKRNATAERVRRSRERNAVTNTQVTTPCNASPVPTRPDPSRPVPFDIPAAPAAPRRKPAGPVQQSLTKPEPTPSTAVWDAYAKAFAERHGDAPPRSAKANAQIKQFLAQVPAAEAPEIARFYVFHNAAFYVTQMHPLWLLARDAPKLRTEWATGQRINAHTARQNEQTAGNPAWAYALELERKEREGQ